MNPGPKELITLAPLTELLYNTHDVLLSWGPFLESHENFSEKLWPAYSVKLVFSYVVRGIKVKITAKFRASRRLRFDDTKRIMSPEIRPKSFGTFEKQAPGLVAQLVEHW